MSNCESHTRVLSGDNNPAAAVALSLAVDDVAMLAESCVHLLDRANATGVSVENKCVVLHVLMYAPHLFLMWCTSDGFGTVVRRYIPWLKPTLMLRR
jgi:hypothetical protein